jgi:dolichol-phosphate mannosyltransferase
MFSFSTIPLDIITMLGVGVTIIGFLYLAWVLFVWILGIAAPGWTSVIVVLLIMGGIQLISVGVLAQYVGMIFEQSKERPLYLIKELKPNPETQKEPDEPRTDT